MWTLRRKALHRWSETALAAHVATASWKAGTRNDELDTISATLVFHQDPSLLPRRTVRDGDFDPYVVLRYVAEDEDLVAWTLGTTEDMLEGAEGFVTRDEALRRMAELLADDWTGTRFADLPAVIQGAFFNSAHSSAEH